MTFLSLNLFVLSLYTHCFAYVFYAYLYVCGDMCVHAFRGQRTALHHFLYAIHFFLRHAQISTVYGQLVQSLQGKEMTFKLSFGENRVNGILGISLELETVRAARMLITWHRENAEKQKVAEDQMWPSEYTSLPFYRKHKTILCVLLLLVTFCEVKYTYDIFLHILDGPKSFILCLFPPCWLESGPYVVI